MTHAVFPEPEANQERATVQSTRELGASFWEHIGIVLACVLLLWAVKGTELMLGLELAEYGLVPRTQRGLVGILSMPFLHADLNHLFSNSFALWVSGFLLLHHYPKLALRVSIWIALLGGLLVWLLARDSTHIGASGLIYGYWGFLFLAGLMRRDKASMGAAFVVVLLFGGEIWWVFPIEKGISWEGHLFGLLTGSVLAVVYRKQDSWPAPQLAHEGAPEISLFPPESLAHPEVPLAPEQIPTAERLGAPLMPALAVRFEAERAALREQQRAAAKILVFPASRVQPTEQPDCQQRALFLNFPRVGPPPPWERPALGSGIVPIMRETSPPARRYRYVGKRMHRLRIARVP